MIGFLERDLRLTLPGLRIYAVILLIFAFLVRQSDSIALMFGFYLVLFSATALMSLFNYDDFNHWQAYAAAMPNGRAAMVSARYVLALLYAAAVFLLQLLSGFLRQMGAGFILNDALLYLGAFLLYAAVVLPLLYRFGGTKGRTIIVVFAAVGAVVAILITTALTSFSGPLPSLPFLRSLPLPVIAALAGLIAAAVSWRVSRAVMAKKEL